MVPRFGLACPFFGTTIRTVSRSQALVNEALAVLARNPALGVDAALRAACARIAHAPAARRLAESVLAAMPTRTETVR